MLNILKTEKSKNVTTEILTVIPARYNSTRLPGKPLIKLCGKELILWVWEGVRKSALVDRVIVATDCEDVFNLIENAGGEAMMTPSELPTGSDRVAWVAERVASRFVLNVQGDDPMVSPSMIDPLIETLTKNPDVQLAVLAKSIDNPDEITRDSIVKVVFGINGRALYFSRSPIPFIKNIKEENIRENMKENAYYKHIGPYAWRREALFNFASSQRTPLEKSESLEMLRVLENSGVIKCVKTDVDTIEIDTQEDIINFEKFMAGKI